MLQGDRRIGQRERQLDEIARFLNFHRLEVSVQTLGIAHSYLTGADPQLARQVDRQVLARKPVTQDWLEEISARHGRVDELATLATLMQRLEASVDDFSRTSADVRVATSEYSHAIEAHIDELEQVNKAGLVISELASITKAMLRRTRDIEKQMVRSEAQTRALKRRLAEARRSSEEDHLTGLPNRRAFEARFEQEYLAARGAAEPLCVAFCDIDLFKRINDTHGHEAGDRVLKLVAESLSRISGDTCHVARHGGEEFVVLFRNQTLAAAAAMLDSLREELAARRLVNRATEEPFGQVTYSGGVADAFAYPNRRMALRAADAALYRAKQDGRNRIYMATADDAPA